MTRQVRLDDDVADEVERRGGGLSLSGSANLILRALFAAGDRSTPEPLRIVPSEPGPADAPIPRPSRPRSPQTTTERLVEAIGPEPDAQIAAGESRTTARPIDHDDPDAPRATTARRAKRRDGRQIRVARGARRSE